MSLRTVRNPHMKKSVVIIASALLFVDCGPETDCAVELFTLVIAIGLLDLARRLKDLHFYHELRPQIVFFNEASCGVKSFGACFTTQKKGQPFLAGLSR